MQPSITSQDFVHKWRNTALKESAAYTAHFEDVCRLVGHPTPTDMDRKGTFFTYQAGLKKIDGGNGYADVWYQKHFAWEYKGKHANLDKAYQQLQQYREALENPPLLIVCDLETIVIHTNITDTVKKVYTLALDDLLQPDRLTILKQVFFDPYALQATQTHRGVTEEAARQFSKLADLLLFLAASGARRGGVANLCLADLDLDVRRAIVREKGDQEGTVYLTDDAVEAMRAWLAVRPACKDPHVFLGKRNGEDWKALTADGVSQILERYKTRLKLQGPCSPHQFRHRLGRRLAERGVTLGTIAQIMRHKDPSVTILHYGGLGSREVQRAYDMALREPTQDK